MIEGPADNPFEKAIIPYQGVSQEKPIASKLAERILAHSFAVQFKDYQTFHHFGKGDVIVLLGTSTAGKSSLIKSLREIEPKRIEHGIDLASRLEALNYLENNYKEEYEFLQSVLQPKKDGMNILYAIFNRSFYFKENVSENDKAHAQKLAMKLSEQIDKNINKPLIDCKMLDEVVEFSMCGKSSVFDIIEIESVFRHIINRRFHAPIRIALVYCPFHLLSERIAERNKKALEGKHFEEVRAGVFPLLQYAKLFRPKEKDNEIVIETITRKMVEEAFEKNFAIGVEYMEKMDPEELKKRDLKKEHHEKKSDLLQAFGFTKPGIQEVELTPRFKRYDYLIDTSKATPEEAAKVFKK